MAKELLSDAKIRAARVPKDQKMLKMADGGGLFLLVNRNGNKQWRYEYQLQGKRKTLSMASYPSISLKRARELTEDARSLVKEKRDPVAERQAKARAKKATFEIIAREWMSKQTFTARYAITTETRIEAYLLPDLGSRPVADITAQDVIAAIEPIEGTGQLETLRRVRRIASKIFQFAIIKGSAKYNPAAGLSDVFKKPERQNFAYITDPKKAGELLRAIEGYSGTFSVKCALQLAPYLFVRPGELRHAEWIEIDLEAAQWRIPAEKMKMKRMHLVPLSRQVVAILRDLKRLTGRGKYVFPSVRSAIRPMSDNTINAALRRMGFEKDEMTGHGFRSMASTILHEQGWKSAIVEAQLAHGKANKVAAAYNHAEHLPERVKMMQHWADYLDGLRTGADVIPIK